MIIQATTTNLVVNRTLINAKDNSYLIINQVESIFESGEDCGNLLTININKIYDNVQSSSQQTRELELINSINNELSFSLLTYPYISSIAFYSADGDLYANNFRIEDVNQQFFASHMFEELSKTTGPNYWFPLMYRDFLIEDETVANLSMGKKIVNINDGSTLGYLIVNIEAIVISDILAKQDYNYWIIDEDSRIISTNDDQELLEPMNNTIFDDTLLTQNEYIGLREFNHTSYVTTMLPFETSNWRLVGQLPYDELTTDLQQNTLYLFIIIAFVILIGTISSFYFSQSLTRPIKLLKDGMFRVSQGDFNQTLTTTSTDEIGEMASSFNHMSEKVQQLLVTVEEEQLQKREYEMALIQEQIKPHFLYNCLDVIYTLNMMGRQKDAAKATKALADFYRVSLSKGADIITLEEEFKNVTDYLSLQKIRYSDVFDYTIHLPESLKPQRIIKLTLQPIIENAIYHGLKAQDEFGHLTIRAYQDNQDIYIQITDNGAGMEADVAERVLEPDPNRQHYGLYNVYHRIQLSFGIDYGLRIDSQPNTGTTVTVHIPYVDRTRRELPGD